MENSHPAFAQGNNINLMKNIKAAALNDLNVVPRRAQN